MFVAQRRREDEQEDGGRRGEGRARLALSELESVRNSRHDSIFSGIRARNSIGKRSSRGCPTHSFEHVDGPEKNRAPRARFHIHPQPDSVPNSARFGTPIFGCDSDADDTQIQTGACAVKVDTPLAGVGAWQRCVSLAVRLWCVCGRYDVLT